MRIHRYDLVRFLWMDTVFFSLVAKAVVRLGMMVDEQRIRKLNTKPTLHEKPYVVYWMQASGRVEQNEALSFAIETANSLKKPLVVYFGIAPRFAGATGRHYRFMLEGIQEVEKELQERSIPLLVSSHGVVEGLKKLQSSIACLIVDRAYTTIERSWRKEVSLLLACTVYEVEANVVVPVEAVSDKEEYSAATLRRKIEPMISYFAQEIQIPEISVKSRSFDFPFDTADLKNIPLLVESLGIEQKGSSVLPLQGGSAAALSRLDDFIEHALVGYDTKRNDPAQNHSSGLSAYLHFGQISPVTIYHAVKDLDISDVPAFLEQLIVRRELAYNFVAFNPFYDQYEGLPSWARKSLAAHEADPRPITYRYEELEKGETHDPYWNAAQKELVLLGRMHNYLRMYWGKKILEWSPTFKQGFSWALKLNNTYQADGRDPNGYAGVAWCFGKHDRPWVERPIFGNIRYMNDKGLERKFNMKAYLQRIEAETSL
ncbi:MAG: deoxyribodipyrimidine photo-lyase [Sphaerochaeta sp.]|uniref:deoxyribodipyrimidine photo-lyase n=1 Tax=Sphaerochaeta sp. TaxID=1972642 RepID=UPI003D0CD5B7